jgi:N-acetylglucosamine-6-phosphate deacetylase
LDCQVIEAEGLMMAPGFIDLQINGGFGTDFSESPNDLWRVGERLPQYGVTSFLPTVVTGPVDRFEQAIYVLARGAPPGYRGAQPIGFHFEGPFLNPAKKGAHDQNAMLVPSFPGTNALLVNQNWSRNNGVRLVTVAPELPGALELIHSLCDRDVVVAAGHSLANYDQSLAGVQAGIRYGTHLFNAMPPLGHRLPGLSGALLSIDDCVVGLIADGLHVHPSMVDLVWRSKGPQRLNLVTDAMAALGMGSGDYHLGNMDVCVEGGAALLADGTLAGSLLSLDLALRNLMAYTGCSIQAGLQTVTSTPARLMTFQNKGILAAGLDADLVLLTPDGEVMATIVAGQILYSRLT